MGADILMIDGSSYDLKGSKMEWLGQWGMREEGLRSRKRYL
jgi:hypothetical protein